ncbi:MAG: methylated-DNA--[protein]-cysteine S-methyltransferase [Bacteroidia bacterium]|nr:methylated-DNA--[protein]-cysteine S-methyltransferase [Bacteroidia bacterium]
MNKKENIPPREESLGWLETPLGWLGFRGNELGVSEIFFADAKGEESPELPAPILSAQSQLSEYFAGQRRHFDFPLATHGTDFQQKIWQALQNVPYGHTTSYQHLADKIGNPKSVRAVGAANGANPIAIAVPCHRIVGSNGQLTGYAGGLHRKKWLLEHEQKIAGGFQNSLF